MSPESRQTAINRDLKHARGYLREAGVNVFLSNIFFSVCPLAGLLRKLWMINFHITPHWGGGGAVCLVSRNNRYDSGFHLYAIRMQEIFSTDSHSINAL